MPRQSAARGPLLCAALLAAASAAAQVEPAPGAPAPAAPATAVTPAAAAPAPAGTAAGPAPAAGAPAGAAAPSVAEASGPAVAWVSEGGGLDDQNLRALRGILVVELRRRGVPLIEDARLAGVHPPGPEAEGLAAELGASRTFALRVAGRLGARLPLALEELDRRGAVLFSAQLTAAYLEEAEVVVPRLVTAVLSRVPAGETARVASVSVQEARPFRKKPGERFWSLGLPLSLSSGGGSGSPMGISAGFHYEAEDFFVGMTLQAVGGRGLSVALVGMEAAWIPLDGEVSPFLGGGFGYLGINDIGGTGMKLMAGVEGFRLHGVRLFGGIEAYLPFFDAASDSHDWIYNPDTGMGSDVVTHHPGRTAYFALHAWLCF